MSPLLGEDLHKQWLTHGRKNRIRSAPSFEENGLVLGAGTVLADLVEDDERLKALLSTAYRKSIAPEAFGHVRAATARWRHGDRDRAVLHLALSRLGPVDEPVEAARRLFTADGLIRAGVTPNTILKALESDNPDGAPLVKYPGQPRVPPGNGRASGEWTTGDVSPSATDTNTRPKAPKASPHRTLVPVGAAALSAARIGEVALGSGGRAGLAGGLDLGALSEGALASLGAFFTGLLESGAVASGAVAGGAVAAFGVLFIPNPVARGKWVNVGGPGNVSYFQKPDETAIQLRYTTADGIQHTVVTTAGPGGGQRGPDGRVLARWIKAGARISLVISTAALLRGETDEEPNLCPTPVKDKQHDNQRALDYEDYVKRLMNPQQPTPRGMGYSFLNPLSGKLVYFDDCIRRSGVLVEAKGLTYDGRLMGENYPNKGFRDKMVDQATRQLQASHGRPVFWFFAEKNTADQAREIFRWEKETDGVRVFWLPWTEKIK